MTFNTGDIVVPATESDALDMGVPVGARLRVTERSIYRETRVAREDNGLDLGAWDTSRFVLAPSFSVGDKVTIVADTFTRDRHYQSIGTEATVTALEASTYEPNDSRITVSVESTYGPQRYFVALADIVLADSVPAEPETLEAFKIRFLEGAIARGEANGATHSAQVTVALNTLAGLEFLEPSKTLEDFQRRVVDLAMAKKAEHSWCGEPEAYLTDIGLAHLLPVVKTVTMVVSVSVGLPAGSGHDDYERAAREQAQRLITEDTYNLWAPSREYTVTNDL